MAPAWQYFYKPLLPGGAKVAVLLMNHRASSQDLALDFSAVPGLACGPSAPQKPSCKVRDVWAQNDLGTFATSYTAAGLAGHDAAFLTITPA